MHPIFEQILAGMAAASTQRPQGCASDWMPLAHTGSATGAPATAQTPSRGLAMVPDREIHALFAHGSDPL